MADEITVHCPNCDGASIRLKQIAVGSGEVWEWRMEGDVLEIEDVADPDSPEWEADGEARHQFVCGNILCAWEGNLEQLIVRPVSSHTDGEG